MTSGFADSTMMTVFSSTTFVSTFCCSLDSSAPLSSAFFRIRWTASMTSACCARKALPEVGGPLDVVRQPLHHLGNRRHRLDGSGPRAAWRPHRPAPCPSGPGSSRATAGAGRSRAGRSRRRASGPAARRGRGRSAPPASRAARAGSSARRFRPPRPGPGPPAASGPEAPSERGRCPRRARAGPRSRAPGSAAEAGSRYGSA